MSRTTKQEIEGMIQRLERNTGFQLSYHHSGVVYTLDKKQGPGVRDIIHAKGRSEFYTALNGMNRIIEEMRAEKKEIS